MFEDQFFGAGMADSLDHGGVVHAVGEYDAIGEFATKRSEGSIVGDVAGGEY